MVRPVLYLAWAPFFAGAERAFLLTVSHIDTRRYKPHVIAGTEGELTAQMRARGIPCEVHPIRYFDRRALLAWTRSVAAVLRVARRIRPALVHSNDVPSFQPGGYAARLLRIPALSHVRFPDEDRGFRWFLRPGFARALFVSEALRTDAMTKAPGLFEGRSDVLHDGVIVPPMADDAERIRLKQMLGLPLDRPTVALTGQVAEVKGIWEFVDAARILCERRTPCAFAVLGDDLKGAGALRRQMEERVRELGLTGHVHFLGFRPDAPALLPAFDVVAVPSHVEPLGNATLEAMAAGLPVVGSRVGGIPEMIVDGRTGLLVAPRDHAALAGALLHIVTSADERRTMGLAARDRVAREFSLTSHATRLAAIYDDVLAR
jgi:glycosyltransferase involved in cell wall biosynthesis